MKAHGRQRWQGSVAASGMSVALVAVTSIAPCRPGRTGWRVFIRAGSVGFLFTEIEMSRCTWLVAFCGCMAAPAAAQQRYEVSDSVIAAAAAAIVQNAEGCAAEWPGYWHAGKPLGLTRWEDGSVFVYHPAPPAGFQPVRGGGVPQALRGSWYVRRVPAAEFRAMRKWISVGEAAVPLVAPYSHILWYNVDALYNRAFHQYQDERFAPLPGGIAAFTAAAAPVTLSVPVDEFESLANAERQTLSAALAAPSPDSLRALLQSYLDMRRRRTAMAPDAQPYERYEERIEGMAGFVARRCTGLATGAGPEWARALVREILATPVRALDNRKVYKGRAYAVGAALGMLLDDLRVPGWRAAVEAGAALDDLLAGAVDGR